MKTSMSRFQIHDDLTAPEGSVPVLRGALATGGQLPNFLGVLAGSPAALRAYARFRSELRHGKLTLATLERIALAVADHHRLRAGHRDALAHGAGRRAWRSTRWRWRGSSTPSDPREAALLRYLQALVEERGRAADAPPRGGARGRLGRRADPRGDRHGRRSRASPRWSTSPARCRSTAPPRRRGRCKQRKPAAGDGSAGGHARRLTRRLGAPERSTAARSTTRRSS